MCRKTLVVFIALVMVFSVAMGELVELQPVPIQKALSKGPVADNELDEWALDLFTVFRYSDDNSEYYLSSGSIGDTMAVAFQPLAACSIYVGQMQFYTGGNYQAFLWDFNEAASANGRAPNRGTCETSPFGDVIFGPYANSTEGEQDWVEMFTWEDFPEEFGGAIAWGDSMFIMGFVKTQDDGFPQPLADDVTTRRFTYTWFCGPWMEDGYDTVWGSYSSDIEGGTVVDMMMRAFVQYTENPPPIIATMEQLPNTVNAEKMCTVTSNISDDDENFTVELMVSHNLGDPTSYMMTDDDQDGKFEATFSLTDFDPVAAGDMFSYWIETEDEEGAANSNEDGQLNFSVVEIANADADILLVTDGMGDRIDVMLTYLDAYTDITYEWWDVETNKGIDMYTVDGGNWEVIVIGGWGVSVMPTRTWAGSVWENAWNAGKSFIFNDMDYFFGNDEEELPTFAAGDAAYDFFGIESGTNDPIPTDASFYGYDGNMISANWVDAPYETFVEFGGDWADFVVPNANAEAAFEGAELGNVMALSQDLGDQKSVHFAFDIFSNCWQDSFQPYPDDYPDYWVLRLNPTGEFANIMSNTFAFVGMDFDEVEEPNAKIPTFFSLEQNYPNPFNPSTSISFTIPSAKNISLKVYNINGQHVATVFNGYMESGSHSLTFDASELASGVYFYRLDTGTYIASRKMVLMK